MKITTPKFVLRAGLLGAALGVYATSPAFAAPRDRGDRRDVAEARRDLERERRDVRRADSPGERRREVRDVEEARRRLERERRENRRDDRRDGNWNRPGNRPGNGNWNRPGNRPGNGYGYGSGNSNGNWNRPGNRPGYRPGYGNGGYNGGYGYNSGSSFTGVVTKVRSDQSFDVRIGGTTYNVYTNGRLPRGLSNGDTVRINGTRTDGNDIRNASVSLLSNR